MSKKIKKLISEEEFSAVFASFKSRAIVQKIGIYHGSLLYITMDLSMSNRDNMIELGLWGDLWQLFKNKIKICDSDTVTRDFAENQLLEMMRGERLENIKVGKETSTLFFSNGFNVSMEYDPVGEYPYLFILSLSDDQDSTIVLTNAIPPRLKIEYNKE